MWLECSNISQRAPLMPSLKGCTVAGVASSYRPEMMNVGTSTAGRRSMTLQVFSVPMTWNSFGPFISV
jgi:hypothetical protein